MPIQPIRNNVLVKPLKASNVTSGGLFVPESVQRVSNKVQIVAVGRGTAKKKMTLKPGQLAHRVKDWGQEVEENGEKYFIMDASAVIAIDHNDN